MKQVVLAIAMVGTLGVSQADAYTCYVVKPEVPQAFERAKAVFVGEVIEVGSPLSSDPEAPLADRFYRVKFKVAYSWKGAGFREFGVPELLLLSDQGTSRSCLTWGTFLEGNMYLVYADETSGKNLIVQPGKRTVSFANAAEDVKELDRISRSLLKPRSRRLSPDAVFPFLCLTSNC